MTAYYNEIDPYAAQWLRNLIKAGHIAPGDVDERSIVDVRADDLRAYGQCHFFAGIGGWSIALRQAGWPDDRPVWTGSCPCQPFSAAGAGKAADDERHLWPAWFSLIAERRPAIVFGEQVEAAVGWGWLDLVFSDLESKGYACGASVQPACSVGAPHIRQRLWFVANSQCGGVRIEAGSHQKSEEEIRGEVGQQRFRSDLIASGDNLSALANALANALRDGAGNASRQGMGTQATADGQDGGLSRERLRLGIQGPTSELGDPDQPGSQGRRIDRNGTDECATRPAGVACNMADAESRGQREQRDETRPRRGRYVDGCGVLNGFWRDAEWIACTDGKARPVGPGSFPLGHGIQRRASKLRAYGNAIVPQVAAEFIRAATSPITAA